jgi:hypothetical protein
MIWAVALAPVPGSAVGKGKHVKQPNRLLMLSALAIAFSIVGCDCGGDDPKPPVEEPDGGTTPDGGPGNIPDGGPGSQCLPQGNACSQTSGAQCCTGICGQDGRCPAPNELCKSPNEVCQSGGECCTNICQNGRCASNLCRDVGQACTGAEECCTKTCTNGRCAEIPGSASSCRVLGQVCAADAECCSTNCQGGLCTRAYTCKAYGDVCLTDAECCGKSCSSPDGVTAGRCEFVTGGGGGGCRQDGNPCSDGSTCCSRTCVDLGYGATVCQPVSGCKLTGNACNAANDCCGGGSNPNGSVMCSDGRCDNGQSCNGVGNICGSGRLPDGGTTDINASQNCCDGRKDVCKVDSSGVPRCFGGGSGQCPTGYTGTAPCCINDGQNCQFSDQCCGDALCLPNGNGGLTCQRPTCSPLGSSCVRGDGGASACCSGTSCLPVDELNYACQQPRPPTNGPDAGTGGTPDAGPTCKANETSCSSPSQCCSGICTGGVCKPPALCQPQNGACTSGADCCQGLRCDVPTGSTTGTCQPGATCSASGQACSPTVGCCSGLSCETAAGAACTGSEPCVCTVIIN